MNIIDIAIIFIILSFASLGAKRGVIKQLVTTVGFIVVVVLSFYLKNPIAEFLSLNLPFFKFGGSLAGASSLNIILYQLISFIIVVIILETVLKALIKVSGFIEKILKFTIILGIPSKILGFIVGIIEGFIITFILLFFLSQPAFNIDVVEESKYTKPILNSTPVLSNIASGMVDTIYDVEKLILDYTDKKIDDNTLNLKSIDKMLEHKVINKSYVRKLIDNKKIKVVGIDAVLNKYE